LKEKPSRAEFMATCTLLHTILQDYFDTEQKFLMTTQMGASRKIVK